MSGGGFSPSLRCAAAIVIALGAVGAALFTQLRLGMQPCPWCVLQRAIFVAIAIAALPGLLLSVRPVLWFSGIVMGLLAVAVWRQPA